MSSILRPLMIFAGGVVIGAVGFYALQNPTTTPNEEVAGAVGTVDKVHQDQIAASDVILADGESPGDAYVAAAEWLDEVATADDIAGLLDLASPQERTSFAARMPFEMQVAMLGRYDVEDLGRAYAALPTEAKVAFFRTLPTDMQRKWLQGKNVTMTDFEARGIAQQAKYVADLGNREIAAGRKEMQDFARKTAAERAKVAGRSAVESERAAMQAGRSTVAGRGFTIASVASRLVMTSPRLPLEKAMLGAPTNERVQMARYIPAQGRVELLGRSTPAQRAVIVGRVDLARTAKTLGRGDVFYAHTILGRADVAARSELVHSRGNYTLGDRAIFERVNMAAKVAAYEKMTQAEKATVLGAMTVSAEKWAKMNDNERQTAMGKMDIATERAWFQRIDLSERATAVSRLSPGEARQFMRYTPSERVHAFLKAIPTVQRNEILGAAWLGSREMQGRGELQGRGTVQGRGVQAEKTAKANP